MVESEMHFWVIGVCKAEVNVICGDHDISHARARLAAGGCWAIHATLRLMMPGQTVSHRWTHIS